MEWKKTSEYTNANDVLIADYQRFLKKSTITIYFAINLKTTSFQIPNKS